MTTAYRPKWWQRLFPRYGNWGGPGWSGGEWCNDPMLTRWTVPARDDLDSIFKEHDRAYQSGQDIIRADALAVGLLLVCPRPGSLYGRAYRFGAALSLFCHALWNLFWNRRHVS